MTAATGTMCSAIRRASSATAARATASPACAAAKIARPSYGGVSVVGRARRRREPLRDRRQRGRARVDVLVEPGRGVVELARGAVVAAVQLAAQHEPRSQPGADGEEDEVVDAVSRAAPALAEGSEVDVVPHGHGKAQHLAELAPVPTALEPRDVGDETDAVAVGLDGAGNADDDAVDRDALVGCFTTLAVGAAPRFSSVFATVAHSKRSLATQTRSLYVLPASGPDYSPLNETCMADQIVITEKTSQAKDVRAAVGSRYGDVLPAEGHLLDLLEPEDVVPAWKRWSPILLRPEGLYGTRPAEGGNRAAKLKAIREALRTAKRVWLATDCDREGQLIGQEILEHYNYRGQVMRVLFTAQDSQTIRDAFGRAKPNAEYAPLYAAAVARRQADQIYNLSLTRTATVILGRGARGVIGVGRVKTPTLAIVCKRELEIRNFVPQAYFEVVATATVASGQFQMRHAPQERIVRREVAQAVVEAAQDFEGALGVRIEDKRQGPPKLHDLPSLQKLCSSRFGWPASKTLEVAQELYDGQGKKIITYPRAEVRYLPESLISDVPKIVAGLQAGKSFSAIPVPDPPIIRKGASGSFHDKGLEGASHHAVIPNVNTVDNLREVWPRLSIDEKKLFDVIARAYLAAVMPDFRYRQTTATLDVRGFPFRAAGRQPIDLGWRAAFPEWQPADEKGDEAQLLPALRNGEITKLENPAIEDKETRPPPRYNEGTLIEAMQNAWRFVDDEVLRERLKDAKGIGTPATRAEIIGGTQEAGLPHCPREEHRAHRDWAVAIRGS